MEEISCLICYEVLEDQIQSGYQGCYDIHHFCGSCLMELAKGNKKCPIDRKENKIIVLNKDNVEVEVDEYYQCFLGIVNMERLYEMIKDNDYLLSICLSCNNEFSDETYMLWMKDCPRHHRICLDCYINTDIRIRGTCFIGHSSCRYKSGYEIIASKASSIDVEVKLPLSFFMTIGYLHRILSYYCDHELKKAVTINHLLTELKISLKYPQNVCIKCLGNIDGTVYGLKRCHDYHVYCGPCLIDVVQYSSGCEVCGYNDEIVVLREENLSCSISILNFLVREYIMRMEVRNERAQQVLDMIETSSGSDFGRPPNLCLGCFKDDTGGRHYLKDKSPHHWIPHWYCKECIIEITCKDKHCLVESKYYNKMFTDIDGRKRFRNDSHYIQMIKYLKIKGGRGGNVINLPDCFKCRAAFTEVREFDPCPCNNLLCMSCLEGTNWKKVCPFDKKFRRTSLS